MPEEISKTKCNVCGNEAVLMCQRCAEPYCNYVCQREDWQRHKYFCIAMPPLVTIIGLKRNNAETKPEKFTIKNKETPLVPLQLSKNWTDHILPPEGPDYFECRVTFIEENGTIWLLDSTSTESLETFSEKMIEAMRKRKPCIRIEDLSVDALVGVTVDGKMFRGRVLVLHPKLKQVEVCLIDYGPKFTTIINNIYLPLAPMAETKAFAFRAKLPNNDDVLVNNNIMIRLLGTKTHNGVYHAHLQPKIAITSSLPVKLLQANPVVNIVHIFQCDLSSNQEPSVALLQMKVLDHVNADLNEALKGGTAMLCTKSYREGMAPFFVAALTNRGYRRAFLLDYFEEPTACYLVYEMDEGRVIITHELRHIPSELMVHPMRVFAFTVTEGKGKSSLKEAFQSSAKDLIVEFKSGILKDKPEELRTANVTLVTSTGQQICEGRSETFQGQLADLGLKLWLEPITQGQLVFITRVLSHDEVYISSVETKKYAGIFRHFEAKCKPFTNSNDIIIGSHVLVIHPTQNSFRAEITKSLDNAKYNVRNIDTGDEHKVNAEMLRTACRFIQNMPVSLIRIKLKTICDIPSAAIPSNNAAYEMLQKLSEQKEDWLVNFINYECKVADLESAKDKDFLVNRLLPLVFVPTVTVDDKKAAPPKLQEKDKKVNLETSKKPSLLPSPTSSCKSIKISKNIVKEVVKEVTPSIERSYYKNIKTFMIPLAENIEIMLLNSMGVHETGYVTACYFPNENAIQKFQEILDWVDGSGTKNKTKYPNYVPEVGEMCITLYKDDMVWYRGVCQEICDDKVKMLYCDFGNVDIVPLDWVQPLVNDMAKVAYANKCYIKGFDKQKDFYLVEEYLVKQSKLICSIHEGPEPKTRYLSIPNLNEILSKEIS